MPEDMSRHGAQWVLLYQDLCTWREGWLRLLIQVRRFSKCLGICTAWSGEGVAAPRCLHEKGGAAQVPIPGKWVLNMPGNIPEHDREGTAVPRFLHRTREVIQGSCAVEQVCWMFGTMPWSGVEKYRRTKISALEGKGNRWGGALNSWNYAWLWSEEGASAPRCLHKNGAVTQDLNLGEQMVQIPGNMSLSEEQNICSIVEKWLLQQGLSTSVECWEICPGLDLGWGLLLCQVICKIKGAVAHTPNSDQQLKTGGTHFPTDKGGRHPEMTPTGKSKSAKLFLVMVPITQEKLWFQQLSSVWISIFISFCLLGIDFYFESTVSMVLLFFNLLRPALWQSM